jgi:transcriptional regulator with XRE-family HTH domain
MQLHEKINFIRKLNGWSREQMAEKLNMSVNGYAKIERGETNIKLSRIEEITKVLGIKEQDLFGFNENIIFGNNSQNTYINSSEALALELEYKNKEITQLQKQINNLEEIISLLKNNK